MCGLSRGLCGIDRNNNIRAAFVSVFADRAVSVLVIGRLLAAKSPGWVWMEPIMGIVGALVVATWSVGRMRSDQVKND